MTQSYSSEEVSRHCEEKDLWVVMDNEVYDLTKFIKEHPGGEEVLLHVAGQDGTQCFNDIGHSDEAIQLRQVFKIGRLADADAAKLTKAAPRAAKKNSEKEANIMDDDWVYEPPKYDKSSWFPIITGIGIAVYSIIFYYLYYGG